MMKWVFRIVSRLANNRLTAPLLKHKTPRSLVEASLKDVYALDEKVTPELVDRYFDMMLRTGNRQAFVDRSQAITRVYLNGLRGLMRNSIRPTSPRSVDGRLQKMSRLTGQCRKPGKS